MALYNEIISPRFNSILGKVLSIKEGSPAPTLASDIIATIPLEVDRPEWLFLGAESLTSCPVLGGASVGNFRYNGIFNAINSGVLAVIEAILINNENAVAAQFNIKQNASALTGLFRGFPRDQRFLLPSTWRSALQVGSNTEAAETGNLMGRVSLPPGDSIYLPTPIVLSPNGGIVTVESAIVNSIVSCTFFWRERVLESSEVR